MQKRVRKCYGYKEQIWPVEEFQLVGGDWDRVSGTPVSALSPSWGYMCLSQYHPCFRDALGLVYYLWFY